MIIDVNGKSLKQIQFESVILILRKNKFSKGKAALELKIGYQTIGKLIDEMKQANFCKGELLSYDHLKIQTLVPDKACEESVRRMRKLYPNR